MKAKRPTDDRKKGLGRKNVPDIDQAPFGGDMGALDAVDSLRARS